MKNIMNALGVYGIVVMPISAIFHSWIPMVTGIVALIVFYVLVMKCETEEE